MDPQYQPATRPDGLDISLFVFFHIAPNLSCSATSALSKCLPYDSHIRWSQHRQILNLQSKSVSPADVPEVWRYWKVVVMQRRSSAGSQGGGEGCGQHEPPS